MRGYAHDLGYETRYRSSFMAEQEEKMKLIIMKCTMGGLVIASVCAASVAQAVDNRVPSYWGGVSIKVIETYGNNNSKPLTGARVVLDAKDRQKANAITTRYPVIRFPMQRTSQTSGVNLTRIPPTNVIGEYTLTVTPPTSGGRVCQPYQAARGAIIGNDGSVTISFRKNTGPATTRRIFNFKCSNRASTNQYNGNSTRNNNVHTGARCHNVRVQALGAGARYGSVTLKSCKQNNGKWKIEPYDYSR